MTLMQARKGELVTVREINALGSGRQRLLDMGIIKGAKLRVKGFAPFGDPIIIEINNFEIAIRRDDAKRIEVL